MEFGDPRLPERFWTKIRVEGDCWIWNAGIKRRPNSDRKYAVYTYNGKPTSLTIVLGDVLYPGYDREKYQPHNTCENPGICAKHVELKLKAKYKCRNGHENPERNSAGNCVECKRDADSRRPTRPSGRSRKRPRRPSQPKNPEISVFGDKKTNEIWRPPGWPKEVLGGKLSA